MSAHTKGPWRFLEAGDTENEWNAGRPLTICDATDNDIANVYSSDDATVTVPREQAIANANLIAAAPDMHAYIVKRACVGDTEAQSILDAISVGATP